MIDQTLPMSLNGEIDRPIVSASSVLPRKKTWKELVDEQKEKGKLKGATCAVYSTPIEDAVDNEKQCICGRSARRHSYTGPPKKKFINAEKWASKLAAVVDVTEYGQTSNDVRVCDCLTLVLYDSFQLSFVFF